MLGHNSRRERRGATIVFVAVLTVALVGMAALAVDASRMYVGVNELQTVSDAAALRGALRLQRAPVVDPSDSIIAFAVKNAAFNGTVTLAATDIKPAIWTDTVGAQGNLDTTNATWANANAVQVSARRSAGLLFGNVLRAVAPVPARRAVAWVANLSGSTCIKPWAFPMTGVF